VHADNTSRMQLADWFLSLLLLTADDPHGRSAVDVTLEGAENSRYVGYGLRDTGPGEHA
jgi:hypothetical protein